MTTTAEAAKIVRRRAGHDLDCESHIQRCDTAAAKLARERALAFLRRHIG